MLKETKKYLKDLANQIRELKNQRPLNNRKNRSIWEIDSEIHNLKYTFRHWHISYCEFRGRTRDQIENPSEFNLPNEDYITKIKNKIIKNFKEESDNQKLYVLVRKDLSKSSPAVQAGHCVSEFCLRNNLSKIWNNNTLIYLQLNNLSELNLYIQKFIDNNIEINSFKEPDLDNQITAICGLVKVKDSKFLKDLKLLD